MNYVTVNNSPFSIDKLFQHYDWLNAISLNDYPVLMMVWNLSLLLVPLIAALILYRYYDRTKFRKKKQKLLAFVLFFIWVLFIPNAAYIITDVRNLLDYCPASSFRNVCLPNAWMILVFFGYAAVGWIAFVFLVDQMRNFFKKIYSGETALLFVIVLIPIVALGVLLGLVDRFSSWAVFTQPGNVFSSLTDYFTVWAYARNWIIFTIGFYILYFVGNKIFKRP